MTLRVGSIGDLHLGKLANVLRDPVPMMLHELDQACWAAVKRGVELITIDGDLTDHAPTRRTLLLLTEWMAGSDKYGVPIRWTSGNHDRHSGTETYLDTLAVMCSRLGWIRGYLEPGYETFKGIRCYFVPWPHRDTTHETPGLVFSHIEYAGFLADTGHPLKSDNRPRSRHFYIVNHLHTHQYRDNVVYMGTLYQTSFGEDYPKGWVLADAEDHGDRVTASWRYIEHRPAFELRNLVITKPEDLQKISQRQEVRYKLHVAPGVKLPPLWQNDYPNVVDFTGVRNIVEREEREDRDIVRVQEHDPTRNLERFLRKKGHQPDDVARGMQIVDDLLRKRRD